MKPLDVGRLAFIFVLSLYGGGVYAFDVDGIRSGMTPAELEVIVKSRGGELWTGADTGDVRQMSSSLIYRDSYDQQLAPSYGFCAGKLVLYGAHFDFDTDYPVFLERFVKAYGMPTKIVVRNNGRAGGGTYKEIAIRWYSGSDRIELSFAPEERFSSGKLKHGRSASVGYASKNSCWKQW